MRSASTYSTVAVPLRHDQRAGIACDLLLQPRADKGRLRAAAGAPTAAACWNPSARGWRRRARGTGSGRPRRAHDLVRRDVHVLDLLRFAAPGSRPGSAPSRCRSRSSPSRRRGRSPGRSYERLPARPSETRSRPGPSRSSPSGTGVSMKPNSLTRAWMQSDEIRPMFGPSGVSIGQRRP